MDPEKASTKTMELTLNRSKYIGHLIHIEESGMNGGTGGPTLDWVSLVSITVNSGLLSLSLSLSLSLASLSLSSIRTLSLSSCIIQPLMMI